MPNSDGCLKMESLEYLHKLNLDMNKLDSMEKIAIK